MLTHTHTHTHTHVASPMQWTSGSGLQELVMQWTPGVGDGQVGLACCGSWGCKELDMTEQLN